MGCGPKPERPGLVQMGTVIDPVPVTELAAKFPRVPRMGPAPFRRELDCKEGAFCAADFLHSAPFSACSLERLSCSLLAFIFSFPAPWGGTTSKISVPTSQDRKSTPLNSTPTLDS